MRLSRLVFLLIVVGGQFAFGEATLNLRDALADTKAKLNSGGQANIMVLGDSLSLRDGSYLPYFRSLMQARYGDAGAGYEPFSIWTGGGLDPGWDQGLVNNDVAPHQALDGFWISTNQDQRDGWLKAFNSTIQLQYVAQPGGGTFRPFDWENGFTWLGDPINTDSPVRQVKTWTYQVPASVPEGKIWYLTQGTGTVTILGQNNISSNPGIRIDRAANGGWTTANFLQRDDTFDQQVKLQAPDLVMILLGANDSGGMDATQFKANMNALIDRVKSDAHDAEVVLITPYDISPLDDPDDHVYQRIVVPDEEIAEERDVGLINLHEIAGEYSSFWLANGFLDDPVHLSPAGGQYLGNLLFNVFQSDGLSPRWDGSVVDPFRHGDVSLAYVPEPVCLPLIAAIAGFTLRRRLSR